MPSRTRVACVICNYADRQTIGSRNTIAWHARYDTEEPMAPDLNLLIALDALLEEGSVAGAARRMNLSPPAKSRTLARIRETVGDPIFVQAGRKMVPTPRALALRGVVRETVERASQLLAPSADVDLRTLDKQFNVRANDIFVGMHGGRLLEEMARGMPRAMLRFTPEEDDVDDDALRSGRIDLFISAAPISHARTSRPRSRSASRTCWRWKHRIRPHRPCCS